MQQGMQWGMQQGLVQGRHELLIKMLENGLDPVQVAILQVSGWPRSKVWPNVNLSRVLICVRCQRCGDAKFCDLYG